MIEYESLNIVRFLDWCDEGKRFFTPDYTTMRRKAADYVILKRDENWDNYEAMNEKSLPVSLYEAQEKLMSFFHDGHHGLWIRSIMADMLIEADFPTKMKYNDDNMANACKKFCACLLSDEQCHYNEYAFMDKYEYYEDLYKKYLYFRKVLMYNLAEYVLSDEFYQRLADLDREDYIVKDCIRELAGFIRDCSKNKKSFNYDYFDESTSVFKYYIPEGKSTIVYSIPVRRLRGETTIRREGKEFSRNNLYNNSVREDILRLMTNTGSLKKVQFASMFNSQEIIEDNIRAFADEYEEQTGHTISEREIRELINDKSFAPFAFMTRVAGIIMNHRVGQSLTLENYKKDKHKCFILFRGDGNDDKVYKQLISGNNFQTLDEASGDFMDILYGKKIESVKGINSGYLNAGLSDLPCIQIWKEDYENAKTVSINKLDNSDIIGVITKIVDTISHGGNLDEIQQAAEEYVNTIKGEKRPMTFINAGNNAMINTGDNVTITNNGIIGDGNVQKNTYDFDEAGAQVLELRKQIEEIEELDAKQIAALQKRLDEMKEACDKKDKGAFAKAAEAFKNALEFVGDKASKLIDKAIEHLPELATMIESAVVVGAVK